MVGKVRGEGEEGVGWRGGIVEMGGHMVGICQSLPPFCFWSPFVTTGGGVAVALCGVVGGGGVAPPKFCFWSPATYVMKWLHPDAVLCDVRPLTFLFPSGIRTSADTIPTELSFILLLIVL